MKNEKMATGISLINESRPWTIFTTREKLPELNPLRKPGILETIIFLGGDTT
ncbi:MAG: hypothetical protein AB7S77_03145 [Desulfatirhabdiaceae bacterium]